MEKAVNECFVNNTSSNLVTDSSRYLLFRRAKDDPSYPAPPSDIHTHRHQAHFKLSPPVGNRGLLNLATPESDLEPVDARPRLLCHKPLGLGLALSFDLPEDVDGSGVDSPVKQGEKDQGRRKRASGSRWPNRSLGVETRSRAATEGVTRAEAGAGVDRSGEGGGGGTGQDMDNGRRKGSSNAANHYVGPQHSLPPLPSAWLDTPSELCTSRADVRVFQSALKPPDSGISISSDVLLSPIPTLAPHLVRSSTLFIIITFSRVSKSGSALGLI